MGITLFEYNPATSMFPVVDFYMPKIEYRVQRYLSTYFDESFITEIDAQMTIFKQKIEDDIIVGRARFLYIDPNATDYPIMQALDVRQELVPYFGMYHHNGGWSNDVLKKIFNTSRKNSDVLDNELFIVDRLEILPEYRGKGLAKIMMDDGILQFSKNASVIAMKVFPLQFELESTRRSKDEIKWDKSMKLDKLNQDEILSKNALCELYKSWGFVEVIKDQYPVMAKLNYY